MGANVQIGNAEVSVEDVLKYLQQGAVTLSLDTQDSLTLASIVGSYTGPLNTTTLKDTLMKAGIKYV